MTTSFVKNYLHIRKIVFVSPPPIFWPLLWPACSEFTYFCHFAIAPRSASKWCKVVPTQVEFINPGRHSYSAALILAPLPSKRADNLQSCLGGKYRKTSDSQLLNLQICTEGLQNKSLDKYMYPLRYLSQPFRCQLNR